MIFEVPLQHTNTTKHDCCFLSIYDTEKAFCFALEVHNNNNNLNTRSVEKETQGKLQMSETELSSGYHRTATSATSSIGGRKPSVSTISTNNLEISNRNASGTSLSPNYERRKLSLRSNKSRQRQSSNRSSRTSASGPDSPTKSEKSESSTKSGASKRKKNSLPDMNYTTSRRPTQLKSSFLRRKIKEYEGEPIKNLLKKKSSKNIKKKLVKNRFKILLNLFKAQSEPCKLFLKLRIFEA